MSRIGIYIKPFSGRGVYADDYIDVTADTAASSVGSIKQSLDISDFDAGSAKFDSISLTMNNQTGSYGEASQASSIFNDRRGGSLVKITWLFGDFAPICGLAVCGEAVLGPEITIFEGLLNDDAAPLSIEAQDIKFTVLGKESLFTQVETPYSTLANGDSVSTTIFNVLNDAIITDHLSLLSGNISPSLDFDIDDISDFENTTADEVVSDLLNASNSVLRIEDDVIKVMSRDASTDLKYTFHGQSSLTGIENIVNIKNYRVGLNRTWNIFKWSDSSLSARNTSSIVDYGARKKELSFDFVTSGTTKQDILDELVAEFGAQKTEMELRCIWDTDTTQLKLLDKVSIVYPTTSIPSGDDLLPLVGAVNINEFAVPFSESSLTIDSLERFKIIGITSDIKKEEINFKLRRV